MSLLRQVVAISIIFISTSFSAEQSESKAKPKVEDLFKVNWSSVTYNKTVSVHNPEVTGGQRPGTSERLSLSCQIEILDPNLVLGTCATPVIEEAKDGSSADIIIMGEPGSAGRSNYEAPRFIRRFSSPPQPPKWKTAIRSTLRLSSPAPPRPQLVDEIQPMPMNVQLDVGLSKQAGKSEISRIKGYFYALVAESLEYVDVPFKPSDDWVRLTEDLEIRLKEAQCNDSSYRFNIEVTPKNTAFQPILFEGYLPDRMVMARQFIDQDGKATRHSSAFRHLPARIGGSGGGGGSDCQIKSIRFVIAVNPKHCEIPFVLEDIPIPKP